MAYVFEEFVRNFYKIEKSEYKVGREDILWDMKPLDDYSESFLPKMVTDISIERSDSKVIIDTKYYKETLVKHFDREKIHSGHLLQLHGYLDNLEAKGGINKNCSGVLLYPTVDKPVRANYRKRQHRIMVRTIDLKQNWKSIHKDLIEIVEEALER